MPELQSQNHALPVLRADFENSAPDAAPWSANQSLTSASKMARAGGYLRSAETSSTTGKRLYSCKPAKSGGARESREANTQRTLLALRVATMATPGGL